MKSCCFTGHRELEETKFLTFFIKKILSILIEKDYTDFYAGGALGWDMLCEKAVLKLRDEKYPHIRLRLVLPCPAVEQTMKWSLAQREEYNRILESADSVEYTSDFYYDGCMKKRNQRIIDLADCCFCYYDSEKSASGTGQTVRMAQRKNIRILNAMEMVSLR
ncbi:MAG: SLOG family protein [Oscillospiraceae bacterium]